jgi:hypothetical protein
MHEGWVLTPEGNCDYCQAQSDATHLTQAVGTGAQGTLQHGHLQQQRQQQLVPQQPQQPQFCQEHQDVKLNQDRECIKCWMESEKKGNKNSSEDVNKEKEED